MFTVEIKATGLMQEGGNRREGTDIQD